MSNNSLSTMSSLFKEVYADALKDMFLPTISYETNGLETSVYISDSVYIFYKPKSKPPKAANKLVVWEE